MNHIPMAILEFRFNEAGETEQVVVGFQTYSGRDNLNARLNLSIEDIKAVNQNWDFQNLNQERAEVVARRKLRDWVMVEKSVEEPVPEEPTPKEGA